MKLGVAVGAMDGLTVAFSDGLTVETEGFIVGVVAFTDGFWVGSFVGAAVEETFAAHITMSKTRNSKVMNLIVIAYSVNNVILSLLSDLQYPTRSHSYHSYEVQKQSTTQIPHATFRSKNDQKCQQDKSQSDDYKLLTISYASIQSPLSLSPHTTYHIPATSVIWIWLVLQTINFNYNYHN